MKNSIEWFYALVSGKLVKPEAVFVKCPHCGELCKAHDGGDCPTNKED